MCIYFWIFYYIMFNELVWIFIGIVLNQFGKTWYFIFWIMLLLFFSLVFVRIDQWWMSDSFGFSFFFLIFLNYYYFFIVLDFVIHWNESAMGLHVFPIPIPTSHLPLHPIPLGLPSVPGPSACLMHPTWAGDLFHPR